MNDGKHVILAIDDDCGLREATHPARTITSFFDKAGVLPYNRPSVVPTTRTEEGTSG